MHKFNINVEIFVLIHNCKYIVVMFRAFRSEIKNGNPLSDIYIYILHPLVVYFTSKQRYAVKAYSPK